jgi:hypothetical protein
MNAAAEQVKERERLDETEARPAPVLLAGISGMSCAIAAVTPLKSFYMLAVMFGIYAIQITIWRAAQMVIRELKK